MTPTVSIIIPTTALKAREHEIARAIASVLDQSGVDVQPILVVNGARFDPALVASLKADDRVVVVQIDEGNVSRARHAGVRRCDRPFFGFLDDDDEMLPGAVAARLKCFDDAVDVVVSNGWYRSAQGDETVIVPDDIMRRIEHDPLDALLDFNWFSAACGLFRAATMPPALFDIDLKFYECTWIALSLIDQRKTIRRCEIDGFRMHQGTPASASKTKDYCRANPEFIRRMRRFERFGDAFDRTCRRRLPIALNLLSQLEMEWGHYGRAWVAHLRCLASGGLGYLPYTRRLLRPPRR